MSSIIKNVGAASAAKNNALRGLTLPPASVYADPSSDVANFQRLPRLPIPTLARTHSAYAFNCRGLLPLAAAANSSSKFSFALPAPTKVVFGVSNLKKKKSSSHHQQQGVASAPQTAPVSPPLDSGVLTASLFSPSATLEEGHAKVDAHIKVLKDFFESHNGLRAQRELEEMDAAAHTDKRAPHNYFEPVCDSNYLAANTSLPVNFSPGLSSYPIPNFNFAGAKRVADKLAASGAAASAVDEGTRNMCYMGGLLASSVLHYYCNIINGGMTIGMERTDWDPSAFANDFGVARVAARDRDYLFRAEPHHAVRQFAVFRAGKAYLVPLVVDDGVPLSADDIASRLMQLCMASDQEAAAENAANNAKRIPIGAYTTTDRRDWYASSRALEQQNARNRANIEAIETSLFVLSLDRHPDVTARDTNGIIAQARAKNQTQQNNSSSAAARPEFQLNGEHHLAPNDLHMRHMLVGVGDDMLNRWFDKTNILLRPFTAEDHATRMRSEQATHFPPTCPATVASPDTALLPGSSTSFETLVGAASFSFCFDHTFNDGFLWSKMMNALHSNVSALCAAESTDRPDVLGHTKIPKAPVKPDTLPYWRTAKHRAECGGFPLVYINKAQRAKAFDAKCIEEKEEQRVVATPASNLGEMASDNALVKDGLLAVPSGAAFLPLAFDLGGPTSKLRQIGRSAIERHVRACDNVKTKAFVLPQFGKAICKKRWRMGPDALLQITVHLAYARLHGVIAPGYAACTTSKYYRGRLEIIRTATPQMRNFLAAMMAFDSGSFVLSSSDADIAAANGKMTTVGRQQQESVHGEGVHFTKRFAPTEAQRQVAQQLLRSAIDAHVGEVRKCSVGHGIDCHLPALKAVCTSQNNQQGLAFFNDEPIYAQTGSWVLSTSNVSMPGIYWVNFGPAVEHGYGIGLIVHEGGVHVGLTTFGQSRLSDIDAYADAMTEAAADVAFLLDSINNNTQTSSSAV